jgi:hypothetical protein
MDRRRSRRHFRRRRRRAAAGSRQPHGGGGTHVRVSDTSESCSDSGLVVMAFTTSHLMCQVSLVFGLESTPFDTLLSGVLKKNDALACDGLASF